MRQVHPSLFRSPNETSLLSSERRQLPLRLWSHRTLPSFTVLSEPDANTFHSIHPHIIQTLHKWSNKIHSVSPAALLPSKKTTFRTQVSPKSAVDLIREAVNVGRAKAVGRTRVRRGNSSSSGRIGDGATGGEIGQGLLKGGVGEERDEVPAEEGDAEVFDDTDFYQEMLRDVIDSKTGKDGQSSSCFVVVV